MNEWTNHCFNASFCFTHICVIKKVANFAETQATRPFPADSHFCCFLLSKVLWFQRSVGGQCTRNEVYPHLLAKINQQIEC